MIKINRLQKPISPLVMIGLVLIILGMLWLVQIAPTESTYPTHAESGIAAAQSSSSQPGQAAPQPVKSLARTARAISSELPILNFFAAVP
jgi:hypothetical protein